MARIHRRARAAGRAGRRRLTASPRLRARARAALGLEPWPDLAVRHPLFREAEYRALRRAARAFDAPSPGKPVLERGHQTAYLVSRWLAAVPVRGAFHVGYASGRYLFYLSRLGIRAGGVDLPPEESQWARVPDGVLDEGTRRRMLSADFFDLTPEAIRAAWSEEVWPVDVLFTEATFETALPWRDEGVSVPRYARMDPAARDRLMRERLPGQLAALRGCFRSFALIEPEPSAGGAGAVFEGCARQLSGLSYSVWRFRPPFDSLFRLSPWSPVRQTVYAFTGDERLTAALRPFAERA